MNTHNISILNVTFYRFGLSFEVKGESDTIYMVDWNIYKGWVCDCPDHIFRHTECKHIQACHDYAKEHGLLLHVKLWCDDPKSDEVYAL